MDDLPSSKLCAAALQGVLSNPELVSVAKENALKGLVSGDGASSITKELVDIAYEAAKTMSKKEYEAAEIRSEMRHEEHQRKANAMRAIKASSGFQPSTFEKAAALIRTGPTHPWEDPYTGNNKP